MGNCVVATKDTEIACHRGIWLCGSFDRNRVDGMHARWRSFRCLSVLSYDVAATDGSLYCRGWDYAFSCCGRVSTILWRHDGDLNCKGDLFGDP